MRVRIVQEMSGGRPDGQPWPAPDETLEVDDAEGAELIASGIAVPAGTRRPADPLEGQPVPDRSERLIAPDGTGDPSAPRPGVLADGSADPAMTARNASKPTPAPAPAAAPAPGAGQSAPVAGTPAAKEAEAAYGQAAGKRAQAKPAGGAGASGSK